ncbi:MAG TPA: ABC transporter permease [Vicinamibacterales bacterium]|nr:ABC transporter permease [Vicinamibacterales bacterium]
MSGLVRDLLHAWRGLTQKPGFLIAALLTMAIGIGANVTIFSLVNAINFRPMPFGERTDRLVTLHPTHRLIEEEPGWGDTEISWRDLLDFRTAGSVEDIGAFFNRAFVLSGGGDSAERVRGGSVTPNLFPLLGIEPLLGRHFLNEEAAPPGLESVVMLTHGLWVRRYGADAAIVGKTIIVNDRARTVVGVLPPGFKFPEREEMYTPFRWDEAPRNARNVNAVASMRPGVTLAQAQSELSGIARRLEDTYPETNRGFGVRAFPIRESYIGPGDRQTSVVLMSAVGFVLLIMCANLANLMLVRGAGQQREMAVRAAMGAGHGRLVWTALCESVLLAVPGSLMGLLASQWAIDAIVNSFPEALPYWMQFDIDSRVALFTVSVATFTSLAVGCLPALRATKLNLVTDLKEGSRGVSLGRAGYRLQAGLAITQVALCFGLLVGANLMVRSFLAKQRADLGFDHSALLTAGGFLAGDAYNEVPARSAFFRRVVTMLESTPGVAQATVTTATPGDDGGSGRQLVIDGRTEPGQEVGVQMVGITETFFSTLGLPVLDGRTFTAQEADDPGARVAVLNQPLAERLWPQQSAIDRRIGLRTADGVSWFRVVGVTPRIHYEEIGEDTEQSRLNVYLPYALDPSRAPAILIRTEGAPAPMVKPIRDVLNGLGAAFPVTGPVPMDDVRRRTAWEEEFFGEMVGAFAVMAALLACLGIYALIAYSVGRRSREIGVRLALGARPSDVIRMLLRESALVGSTGLAAGLMLGVAIARVLASALYGVQVDSWLFVSIAVPLTLALFVATWVPARRAARIEPTIALRDE